MEATKKHVFYILEVAPGGSSKLAWEELLKLVTERGGKQERTVLCCWHKVPAPNTAQVNATMGHTLDYDDISAINLRERNTRLSFLQDSLLTASF